MKRILTTLFTLAIIMAGSVPALAAGEETSTGQSVIFYPISVEEYTYGEAEEPRINKVYQLSLSDDPSGIPTEDFVRNGRRYYLLDMTRKNEVGVDTKPHIETVTQASSTDDMETILQQLSAELEVTTEDGYTGTLQLDHTTVKVTVDGYATKTQALSASRNYPNLSEADVSLIPKSIEENGKTLTLADAQWDSTEQIDGVGGIITRYTATASYTGTSSSRYATGYTVTADYTGEVAKPDCDVVTYTAIFGSTQASEGTAKSSVSLSAVKIPLLAGGAVQAYALSAETVEPVSAVAEENCISSSWKRASDPALTEKVRKVFDKAFEGLEGVSYTPVALLASRTTGSGIQYRILCKATVVVPGAQEEYVVVTLQRGWLGKAEILDIGDPLCLTNLDYEEGTVGTWQEAESPAMTEEATAAFNKATEGLVGVDYVPVALLSTQTVAGTNYRILCEATTVYPGAEMHYAVVNVYESLEGNANIISVTDEYVS